MTLKLETFGGESFEDVAKKAKLKATSFNLTIEFDFNGILCLVDKDTYLDGLFRDYMNAHVMEWKQVGPDCAVSYDVDTDIKLYTRKLEVAIKRKQEQQAYDDKCNAEKTAFNEKIKDIVMEFKDESVAIIWIEGKNKNADPYGACIYEYAEGWAKLMQMEIIKGAKLTECAEKTSHELGFLGITGYMYGAAVNILSHAWKYGEELRKWHNKEYNHEGDGVVNPAILTIKS